MANILLTGKPGVGKTTLIQKLVKALKRPARGFFTVEMREGGRRVGFKLVTLDGREGVLAHENIKGPNQATRILEGGYVDMVGMTRAHMADPHLIAKIKMGQIDQIKQCVGANYCIDRQYQGLDVLCILKGM